MKIIVSHDIDHITALEHKDLLIPKFFIRSLIELYKGVISLVELKLRFRSVFIDNKWQNINEIIEFNKKNDIPSTFFIGVNNGLGLVYPIEKTWYWVKKIVDSDCDIGVHGINFDKFDDVQKEYNLLQNFLGKDIGIRMHYLRNDNRTLDYLSKVGYIYDTTILEDKNPYKIGEMWEFPLHIMETHIFYQDEKRYTSKTFEEYKEITIKRINELESKNIEYMTLLFHDRYFDNSFKIWKNWYIWVIEYLKSLGFEFISYKDAIEELEKRVSNAK